MKNIEIKSPLADRPGTEERLRSLGAELEWTRRQVDTFYHSPSGWLKLREVEGCPAELISYRRSVENSGPRESDYHILRIDEPSELHSVLESSLGILGSFFLSVFPFTLGICFLLCCRGSFCVGGSLCIGCLFCLDCLLVLLQCLPKLGLILA